MITLADAWLPPTGGWLAWLIFTSLIGLGWLRRHLELSAGQREPLLSPNSHPPAPAHWPRLSMLVAAKDEAANIATCVRGLLAQDHPNFELIVINDRSTDQTGAILEELARSDQRLTPLHVSELRPGWYGKNNAMRSGVERSGGEWLCFSDADCTYDSPHLLSLAVREAMRLDAEFLSVLPRLQAESLWERIVQPVASGIMVFWFPPQRVNNPRTRTAYANGAFMLMSRSAYERIGGHAAVRAELNEDMRMAHLAKAAGVRLAVLRSADLFRVRMYTRLRDIWRGWSRIFFGCFRTYARLIGSVLLLSLFSLAPWVTLALAPFAGEGGGWQALAGGFTVLAQQSVLWRFYPVAGVPAVWALTYPIGAGLCLLMTVNALVRKTGLTATTWRGTTYGGDTPQPAEDPPRGAAAVAAPRE